MNIGARISGTVPHTTSSTVLSDQGDDRSADLLTE